MTATTIMVCTPTASITSGENPGTDAVLRYNRGPSIMTMTRESLCEVGHTGTGFLMREIVIDTETTGLDPLNGDPTHSPTRWSTRNMRDVAARIAPSELIEVADRIALTRSTKRSNARLGANMTQERSPDYRVVAAWSAFLIFIGAGAFAVGMAIHNEAHAKPPAPRPEPIYYCATGEEIPLYEPCRDRKDQRDI